MTESSLHPRWDSQFTRTQVGTQPTCPRDGRPIHDQAYICDQCGDLLRQLLEAVADTVHALPEPERVEVQRRLPDGTTVTELVLAPGAYGRGRSTSWDSPAARRGGLVHDLVLTFTRQGVTGNGVASARAEDRPVPWDDRARTARDELVRAVVALATIVRETRGVDWPQVPSLTALAGWLVPHVQWLRHHPDAAGFVEGVRSAVREAEHVVNVRPERVFLGPCGVLRAVPDAPDTCPQELYALADRATVECPACGAVHDVPQRRQQLLDQSRDRLLNAADMAAALTTLERPVKANRIRNWFWRDRLEDHGRDKRGRPLFRVGDVLDLLVASVAEAPETPRHAESA